jgi:hypothetical protein
VFRQVVAQRREAEWIVVQKINRYLFAENKPKNPRGFGSLMPHQNQLVYNVWLKKICARINPAVESENTPI